MRRVDSLCTRLGAVGDGRLGHRSGRLGKRGPLSGRREWLNGRRARLGARPGRLIGGKLRLDQPGRVLATPPGRARDPQGG